LAFDPTFADVAEGRGVLPASAAVRASLPPGLRWVALAGDVLQERIDVMWSPAHAAPARDAFLTVARALPWPALAPTTSATMPGDGGASEPE
jgi:hypothetical protein